jgi:Zn-finger nucleic acid-binding protein
MKCPVCATSDLHMSERLGIEIDYCPQCRGVWLDRGELDKIIAQSVRESVQVAMVPAPQAQQEPRQAPQGYDNRYGQHDKHYGEQQGYRRKKSIWQELFD